MTRTQRIVGYWFPWDKKSSTYDDCEDRTMDVTLDETSDRPEITIQIKGVGMIQVVDPVEFISAMTKAIVDYEGGE